jgi:hypothetical protein
MASPWNAVNNRKDKHSHVALIDAGNQYSKNTTVTVVGTQGRTFDAKNLITGAGNTGVLPIRLKSKGTHNLEKDIKETGQLTVTLTNPPASVKIDVIFVDDDET